MSSGYRVSCDGRLQRLDSIGIDSVTGAGGKPIVLALSRSTRFLDHRNSVTGSINGFVPPGTRGIGCVAASR